IFLGGVNASCKPFLLQNSITNLLSLGRQPVEDLSPEITAKYIDIANTEETDINVILDEACRFINLGTRGSNRILVHCRSGQSWSPTAVIVYLHRFKGLAMFHAFYFVARKRPLIWLNKSFQKYLIV
ncbi:phosphatases II, partial [Fomitiporia mediterranea MF3/22]|uniref:phosphatases II n=1 Tax=Fomitiporia mediterranea (strain MF3/22) TaxID=694068 RepID=UPI000440865E